MEEDNIIKEKSFRFAVRIVKLNQHLRKSRREFVLSKQLIRSGTSIGANVCEALQGSSKKDFINKLNISLKEANETEYWLRLLKETNIVNEKEFKSIHWDCREILRILTSIIKTSKNHEAKESNQQKNVSY